MHYSANSSPSCTGFLFCDMLNTYRKNAFCVKWVILSPENLTANPLDFEWTMFQYKGSRLTTRKGLKWTKFWPQKNSMKCFSYLAFSNVAAGDLPIAPKPTPTARPSEKNDWEMLTKLKTVQEYLRLERNILNQKKL